MALNPRTPTHTRPYLEIQNATDLFHHHQSDAEAKTQIIQMLEGLAYNVIGGLVSGHQAKQNTHYPNPRPWLVRRRHKMNIWLK